MAIVYFIFTVMLLIASGILADNARSYKISGLCDSWESVSGDIECNNLVVAVVSIYRFKIVCTDRRCVPSTAVFTINSGQMFKKKHVMFFRP